MLRNGDHGWGVVGGRVHRAETIDSSGEASSNINAQYTVSSWVVDSLEESEYGGIQWSGRRKGVELLHSDMAVTDDITSLELLRRAIVIGIGVHKVTGDHVLNVHLEGELGVSGKGAKVLWEGDLRPGHVARGDDISNNNTVAAPLNQLLAVCKCLPVTKVDEVIGGRERGRLLINGRVLPIIRACRADHGRVERQRGLRITITTAAIVVVVVIVVFVTANLNGGAVDEDGDSSEGERERDIFHFRVFIDRKETSVACV